MASRQVPLARESSAEVVYTTWACIVEDDRTARQAGSPAGRPFEAIAGFIGPENPSGAPIPQTVAIGG
jgi:hypothetical protein